MSKKVLITGASGGFGSLTAKQLLSEGHRVVGTMRSTTGKNEAIANELKEAGAELIEMDVTNEASVNSGVDKALEILGGIDVVINNAGIGVLGMQEHYTAEDWQKLFNVNVFGVQRVCRAVIPHFRKQGDGVLMFVTSLLGRITLPFYGPYNSSKWAVEAMAENYRAELSGFGIESCVVQPGGYATSFFDNLMQPSDQSRHESYGEFMNAPVAMAENFGEALEQNTEQNPIKVAEAMAKLVNTPFGQKPFRTVVDTMGMGDHVHSHNEHLHEITNGIYTSFGIEGMLKVKETQEV